MKNLVVSVIEIFGLSSFQWQKLLEYPDFKKKRVQLTLISGTGIFKKMIIYCIINFFCDLAERSWDENWIIVLIILGIQLFLAILNYRINTNNLSNLKKMPRNEDQFQKYIRSIEMISISLSVSFLIIALILAYFTTQLSRKMIYLTQLNIQLILTPILSPRPDAVLLIYSGLTLPFCLKSESPFHSMLYCLLTPLSVLYLYFHHILFSTSAKDLCSSETEVNFIKEDKDTLLSKASTKSVSGLGSQKILNLLPFGICILQKDKRLLFKNLNFDSLLSKFNYTSSDDLLNNTYRIDSSNDKISTSFQNDSLSEVVSMFFSGQSISPNVSSSSMDSHKKEGIESYQFVIRPCQDLERYIVRINSIEDEEVLMKKMSFLEGPNKKIACESERYQISFIRFPMNDEDVLLVFRPYHKTPLKKSQSFKREILDNRTKSNLIRSLSHSLRNPVNAIFGLLSHPPSLFQLKQPKYLEMIQMSAKILLFKLDDLLDYSHIELGDFYAVTEKFNIQNLIQEVTEICQIQANLSKVQIITKYGENLPSDLLGDRKRIIQVLVHLILNGIKYSPQNGTVILEVCSNSQGRVQFEVDDNGIGINSNLLKKVDHLSDSKRSSFHGLSLQITNKICEKIGTKLHYSSIKNLGSQFWFSLPPCLNRSVSSSPAHEALSPPSKLKKRPSLLPLRAKCKELQSCPQDAYLSVPKKCFGNIQKNKRKLSNFSSSPPKKEIFTFDSGTEKKNEEAKPIDSDIEANLDSENDPKPKVCKIQQTNSRKELFQWDDIPNEGVNEFDRNFEKFPSYDFRPNSFKISSSKNQRSITTGGDVPPIQKRSRSPTTLEFMDVLIVDDSYINRYVLKNLIENQGIQVEEAINGIDALNKIKERSKNPFTSSFSLIIMDLDMPVMNGITAIEIINKLIEKKKIKSVPVVVLSAYDDSQIERSCYKLKCKEYIKKPVSKAKVKKLLNKYVWRNLMDI